MVSTSPSVKFAKKTLYGRRKGRSLSVSLQAMLDSNLPHLLVDIKEPAPNELQALFPRCVDDFWLEIGFGSGEHLMHHAVHRPRRGFFGVEPFVNGLAKMVRFLAKNDRPNVRLYDGDALELIDWLPCACLSGIDIFYPDPWPKPRHFKRRFINEVSLKSMKRILQPGGILRFVSDIESYVSWTLQHVPRTNGFEIDAHQTDNRHTAWADWPGTRYEKKALREGRTPHYLVFRRTF